MTCNRVGTLSYTNLDFSYVLGDFKKILATLSMYGCRSIGQFRLDMLPRTFAKNTHQGGRTSKPVSTVIIRPKAQ